MQVSSSFLLLHESDNHLLKALFHDSMWGFNVTGDTFPYDNRPVAPLSNMTFQEWWFVRLLKLSTNSGLRNLKHNHLAYPPPPNTFMDLPAGRPVTTEVACDKGATSFFASSQGGNIQSGNNPCPGSPITAVHTNNFEDLRGCALAITYQSDVTKVQPEDFTIFSVNHTCVWTRFTDFQVPARMPACPEGGCICAFFWIHAV